jgi:ankyrin repeat protein
LHAAAGAYNTSRVSIETKQLFEYLLKKFPYDKHLESQETSSGFTPLMIAVLDNNIDAAKALLDAGASLDTKCLAGFCLHRAELLAKLIIASADGLNTGMDFDEINGGRAWRDMMKLLIEADIRPEIKPKVAPVESLQEARISRVERFVKLVRSSNLKCLASQLEKDDTQVAELPAPDDADQSLLSEIVSNNLNPNAISC